MTDVDVSTISTAQRWLSYYKGPCIWLVKEKEAAILVVPFYKDPEAVGDFRINRGGFVTIVRESGSRPEKWWTDQRGNGFDGKPILAPTDSDAATNWKFNPLKHKQIIERSVAFIKKSIAISERDIQKLEKYLEKHVAEPAMIQDIIE